MFKSYIEFKDTQDFYEVIAHLFNEEREGYGLFSGVEIYPTSLGYGKNKEGFLVLLRQFCDCYLSHHSSIVVPHLHKLALKEEVNESYKNKLNMLEKVISDMKAKSSLRIVFKLNLEKNCNVDVFFKDGLSQKSCQFDMGVIKKCDISDKCIASVVTKSFLTAANYLSVNATDDKKIKI